MFQWALWCWGLQWPPLTSSSLRDPVLSCPEVLHCTRLGAAQYRMRRGGSRQEARKHHGPSAALTWLLPSKPPDPGSGLSGEPAPAFCSRQKAGPPEVLTLGFPRYLGTWQKGAGRSSYGIKLDLTPQHLPLRRSQR